MLRGGWFVVVLMVSASVFAAKLPSFCSAEAVRVEQAEVVLHPENNQNSALYCLQNRSKNIFLWLNHEKIYPSASAGWGSPLKAGHWSALMVSQPKFHVVCAELVEDHVENIPCDQVLNVCRVAAFQAEEDTVDNATFWVTENTRYRDMLQGLQARKIFITP